MKLKDRIAFERDEIAKRQRALDFLLRHSAFIEEHELDVDVLGAHIDFDHPTREQTLEIIKHFPGEWQKTYNRDTIDYSTTFDSLALRIWQAPPPPQCVIVEEEIEVPEQLVPAHKEKRRKIVCTGQDETHETKVE